VPASSPPVGHHARHDERLRAPWTWWLLVLGFSLSVWWSFALATPPWVSTAAGVATLLGVGWLLWRYGNARVAVVESSDGPVVIAGRARIALALCGSPVVLDGEQLRHRLGPGADVRSYALVRPWSRQAVLLPITDPADPTPSWILASGHAAALAEALRATRAPLAD